MKPPSTKIEETRITCKKIKISLLDNSTNKKLLEKLKSKKFNYSVLAFLECRYYVQNLVIWQKESPVSQIYVSSRFRTLAVELHLVRFRIRCLFYI